MLAHLAVFDTDCAHMLANYKLLSVEVGNLRPRVQDRYSDAVTEGCTPPPSSHGSCKPIDEYPNALREPCRCGDKAGVPAANGTTSLVTSCYIFYMATLNLS